MGEGWARGWEEGGVNLLRRLYLRWRFGPLLLCPKCGKSLPAKLLDAHDIRHLRRELHEMLEQVTRAWDVEMPSPEEAKQYLEEGWG